MNLLDMRTVVFSYAISNFICLVVIVLLWRRNRARFPGLGLWAADFALQFAALVLISLRGTIPDILSMTGGNTMAVAGAILLYAGLERFTATPAAQFHNWILLAVFAAAHAYFAVISPDLKARNILISSAILLICLQCAWLMLRRRPPEMLGITRGVGYVFAAFALINAVRILVELAVPSGADLFNTNIYEKLFLLGYQMTLVVLTFALSLMVNHRLFVDLENDISARRRTEEALRLSEEKFSKAFRSSPDAVLLSRRRDGLLIEVNESFCRLTGYSRREALSSSSLDLGLWAEPREREKVMAELPRVREHEFDIRTKAGAIRRVLYSGETINIGGEECVLSIIRDITEKKRSEEALRLSEERHRSVFEISPVGICLLGLEGNLESVNPAGAAIFGYTAGELPGLKVGDIVPKITRPDLDLLVKNIGENGPQIFESEGRKKNGTAFPLQVSAALYRLTDGERLFLILVDLTGQKQAAEAEHLQRLAKTLLRFQEEERKHLARELHDHLGQDLATIKIGLALARKDHPKLAPRLAEEIDESIRTADKIIADVRRISAGLRPESIDKIGLLPVLEDEIRRLSSRSGVAITLDSAGLEERLPSALEIAVYRIVQEALTNVIKHASSKSAQITIRRGEAGIVVTIRDDGRGFPPERGKTGGLGLLGIRERVAAEGGSLRIESSPGEGTSLCVTIPLRPEETGNRNDVQPGNHGQA